jgi:hypothetical protein
MKIKLFTIFFILAFNPAITRANSYAIIPKPLETVIGSDQFIFSNNFYIDCNSTDKHLQNSFQNWVSTAAIKKAKANKMVQTKLSLLWVGPKKWNSFLRKLGLKSSFNPGEEGYVVSIEKNSILVLAQSDKGLFYGFQTLQQLFNQDSILCGQIYDKPSFAIRAWQDDVSRGPIPTLAQLKKEIKVLSHYKLNYFTLYTEHVFKYIKYPGIAPKEGISAADIEELSTYAKQHYVTLIANQQSFGHLEKLLKTPGYEDLAINKHIISPTNPRTYPMFKNLYEEQNKAYQSTFFHINADETFGLSSSDMYAFHIKNLHKLLQTQGNTLIMWSDIVTVYPEIIPQLPKDIVLIPWAYDAAPSFKKMLQPIAQSGLSFWVAPGINNWLNVYPNQLATKDNIYNLVRDGYAAGATGVLNTSWDDDGFALFGNNWQGFIWGADISWNAPEAESKSEPRWEQFEKNLDIQFWQSNMQKWVKQFYQLHQIKVLNPLKNETFFEPILPLYPEYLSKEKEKEFTEINELLTQLAAGIQSEGANSYLGKESLNYLQFSLQLAQFSNDKNRLRILFSSRVSREKNAAAISEIIAHLQQQLLSIKATFSTLYLQENKTHWLLENIQKLDYLAEQINQLPYYFEIVADEQLSSKGRKYSYVGQTPEAKLLYAFGNNQLHLGSVRYTKPIYSKQDLHLNAGIYAQGKIQFTRKDSFVYHQAIGSIQHINLQPSKYHPSYVASGKMALVDGKIGDVNNLKSGLWQGYSGGDLQIELFWQKPVKAQSFAMGFYQNTPSWVILPKQLEIYLSENGKDYVLFQTLSHLVPINKDEALKFEFKTNFAKRKIKHMRIVAKYAGNLPPKHPGEGLPSMLFADEIILK